MNRVLKNMICFALIASLLAGFGVCFAVQREKNYCHYNTVVQLGDSVAAGYDEKNFVNTEFSRVDHSYSAIIADTLGAELVPLACQGFRTIEMRYMLEDDFVPDEYLFHDTYDIPATIARIPQFRQSIADADLITLGLGGNDVGTYLAWVVLDEMEKDGALAEYVTAAREKLKDLGIEDSPINSLIDLADTMDALPGLMAALPKAISFGVSNYIKNWTIVMDDIYALNPDVTLVVPGMFDTGYQNETDFDDNSIKAQLSHKASQMIVDAINLPMKANADKYGYIYVEMEGIICYGSHPTPAGYAKMAEKILAALPEAESYYDDVRADAWYYDAVNYVTDKHFMIGTAERTFEPDSTITYAQLSTVLYRLAGNPDVSGLTEPFYDVSNDFWAHDAIVWAYNNGLLKNMYVGKTLCPNMPMSRANFTTMLYRYAGSPAANGSLKFSDSYAIPAHAQNAVAWAAENGIVQGYENGTFRPLKSVTRAETAIMIMRFCRI